MPMSSTYVDVVGPLAKTVRDAAIVLDVLAGSTPEDPRTLSAKSHIPELGYAAGLSENALEGKRFGLVGEGWRTSFLPLAPETEALYKEAVTVLEAQGAEVVEDPFMDSGFVELYSQRRAVRSENVDEMLIYLQGLGNGASFSTIEEWEALTGEEFRRGRRSRNPERPRPKEGSGSFLDWRMEIQTLFLSVLEEYGLDGLFFPQAGSPIPDLIEDPERPDYNPNNHPELPSNIVNDIGVLFLTLN